VSPTVSRARPVAVIAAGVATPLGLDLDAFWSALSTGVDGISTIERFRVDDLRVGRGGEIKKLRAPRRGRLPRCRASALLTLAADDLLARATLAADPARVAVVVGTALGGVEEGERALAEGGAHAAAAALYDSPAHALARRLSARGPVLTVSTACASGATAMGVGADLLTANAADLVVAGGYDVLCRFVMRGFDALRSLTRERVRPFDRRRSGLLLGEAAALVLMARDADAPRLRLGRLLGHASSSDGSHVAAPDPDGRGLEHAVRGALAAAGVGGDAVDFVSAHGTGTRSTTESRRRCFAACSARARAPYPSTRSRARSATRWAPPQRWRQSCACSPRATASCRARPAMKSRIRRATSTCAATRAPGGRG